VLVTAIAVSAQTPAAPGARETIAADEGGALSEWDGRVRQMIRRGELKRRQEQTSEDGVRRDEWFQQLHKGVPVDGAEVWRQQEGEKTTAIEGTIFTGIHVNPVPKLTRAEALAAFQALTPDGPGPSMLPQLVILPRSDGTFVLVYRARVYTSAGATVYALDASTGAEVMREPEPSVPEP
jgi:hypothetical protein